MVQTVVTIYAIVAFIAAMVVAWAASEKGRSGAGFALMAFLLSPIFAALILTAIPPAARPIGGTRAPQP